MVTLQISFSLGLRISGNESIFPVGQQATLVCSSDFAVTSIQWLYEDDAIVTSSDSTAELVLSPVTDELHLRQYVCVVTTSFGMEDRTVSVSVQGKYSDTLLSLETSIMK